MDAGKGDRRSEMRGMIPRVITDSHASKEVTASLHGTMFHMKIIGHHQLSKDSTAGILPVRLEDTVGVVVSEHVNPAQCR